LVYARRVPIGPIRVVLADDHPITREPLRELLAQEDGFVVVGEASDGAEALWLTRLLRPDLLVLDIDMPVLPGLRVAEEVAAEAPETKVVLLTGFDSPENLRAAARLGVAGFVSKTRPFTELVTVLRAVHGGQISFPAAATGVMRAMSEADGSGPTPREKEVLRLVELGHRNRDIATRLSISEATVQFHLRQLFAKLRASSRTELVHLARQQGWLE
jgi:DNA-binding NarL/FixJ family response regulator